MEPEQAMAEAAEAVKQLFSHVGNEARMNFIYKLIGNAGDEKTASMVHL
ncbi:MAG: hypothetical protein HC887_10820 [Desulfobacteraceae bacterium]|nr:hypothetical protein [Desulfobacteraceae bacterium]